MKRHAPLILLIVLSIFAWAPLTAPGYFLRAHDAAHNLFWLAEFDAAIRDGFLYPRWAADHAIGLGYPIWNFYAPLAYFIAEGFHLGGLSIVGAIKITWVLAFIASGFTMYRFARRLWGPGAGFIAGLLYIYAPYHLVNIYVRAALAEFVAYALFPWVLHAFLDLVEKGGWKHLALAALAFGLTLLTHSVTVVIFPPFIAALVLYWLILLWRRNGHLPWRRTGEALAAGILGIALAAIFLLPALAEGDTIVQQQWVAGGYNYLDQFLYSFQLLASDWGFGYSSAGPNDGMSLQIGLWLVILGFAALPFLVRFRPPYRDLLLGFLVAAIIAILLMMSSGAMLWEMIPSLALLQFPFRLLALVVLFMSLVAAGVVGGVLSADRLQGVRSSGGLPPVVLALGLAIILASYPYTRPEHTDVTERDQNVIAVIDFETKFSDMRGMTAWTTRFPEDSPQLQAYQNGEPLPLAGIVSGQGVVEAVRHGAGSEEVVVLAETPVTVEFYNYWYPGWRAWANGEAVETRPAGDYGLVTVDLPAGEYEISIRLTNTPVRTVATVITLLAVLIILLLLVYYLYQSRRNQSPRHPTEL